MEQGFAFLPSRFASTRVAENGWHLVANPGIKVDRINGPVARAAHDVEIDTGEIVETTARLNIDAVRATAQAIAKSVGSVIEGKAQQINLATVVLLSGGHLLVEDVPGVGKTMLAKAMGRTIDCTVRRIQFTPDLLPSDITGVSIYDQATREFEFKPGGIFANIVVGDEINRASPKTQSALLEAMAERQVSVDGTTHQLPKPFMVMATQNPIEMEGTYSLPEAQRDRFMARITMGYPARTAEIDMLSNHGSRNPLDSLMPITDTYRIAAITDMLRGVHATASIKEYVVDIVAATRESDDLRLGASPRASLQLLRASRTQAAIQGRDYVIPDDIQALAEPILAHRVVCTPKARLAGVTPASAIAAALRSVPAPTDR